MGHFLFSFNLRSFNEILLILFIFNKKPHFYFLSGTIHYTFKNGFSLKGKFFLDFSLVFLLI